MTIRLLIADDHELVRAGLHATFEDTDVEIVGEASNCHEAIRQALESEADVMLLDLSMPGGGGFAVLDRLRSTTSIAIIIFSMHDRPHSVERALELGAIGFLTKMATRCDIIAAVRAASCGKSTWISGFEKQSIEVDQKC